MTPARHIALQAFFLSLSCSFLLSQSFPQSHPDPSLHRQLEQLVAGFGGNVGLYVRHLSNGSTVSINADSLFPTASMIKVPILCALAARIQRNELRHDSVVVYRDSMKYDDGITGSFKDSTRIPIQQLAHLMISVSDNTASLWLQSLAGTGIEINTWLEQNGFRNTRVNSRTPGREDMRSLYGWGVTTPREMADLVALIRTGKAVSPAASDWMYRILCRSNLTQQALSQIPPYVQAASKQGAVNESRSEVVLVNSHSGDYVFCVITKNQTDQSWGRNNEGYTLIRNISRALWRAFEPKDTWHPVLEIEETR